MKVCLVILDADSRSVGTIKPPVSVSLLPPDVDSLHRGLHD